MQQVREKIKEHGDRGGQNRESCLLKAKGGIYMEQTTYLIFDLCFITSIISSLLLHHFIISSLLLHQSAQTSKHVIQCMFMSDYCQCCTQQHTANDSGEKIKQRDNLNYFEKQYNVFSAQNLGEGSVFVKNAVQKIILLNSYLYTYDFIFILF